MTQSVFISFKGFYILTLILLYFVLISINKVFGYYYQRRLNEI